MQATIDPAHAALTPVRGKKSNDFVKQLKEDLREVYSYPDSDALPRSSGGPFVAAIAVRTVINAEAITRLLAGFEWFHEGLVHIISMHLSLVIGILVSIGWTRWEDFKVIFLDQQDQVRRPLRGDHRLPFSASDLSFIRSMRDRHFFERYQYIFCPLVITEDAHIQCSERIRLPFLTSEALREGGFGQVTKEQIEVGQVIFTSGQSRNQTNDKKVYLARKVIAHDKRGTKSFEKERKVLESIKRGSTNCKGIAVSFATFVHGDTLNLLSPLADLDLFDFLRGRYEGFTERASAFTPRHLFEQARCVANALHFLHQELDIEGGFSCAHMDLKPENILVEWQKVDYRTRAVEDDKPVGIWMITDFGISVLRELQENEGPGDNLKEPNDRVGANLFGLRPLEFASKMGRHRSSVGPPRGPGPFQAPEMLPGSTSKVDKPSDMWSFGCILAMILAFVLGGPEKAGELYGCRVDGYADDYFYTVPKGKEPEVKTEVHEWLMSQSTLAEYAAHKQWVEDCQILISSLFSIDMSSRPTAKDTRQRLQAIRSLAEDEKLPWSPPANNPFLDAEGEYPRAEKLQRTPSDSSTTSDKKSPPPSDGVFGQPLTNENTSLSSRTIPMPSLAYSGLIAPAEVRETCISPDGSLVVFVGRGSVYMYELEKLYLNKRFWTTEPAHVKHLDQFTLQDAFYEANAEPGRQWTSALLAGSFVALISRASEGNDISVSIKVYNRASHQTIDEFPQEERQIDIGPNFMDIRLSSKGALVVMFVDHIDIYPDTASSTVNLSPPSQFQTSGFSTDGRWFCVWFTTITSYCWEIWDTSTWDCVGEQACKLPPNPPHSSNHRKWLVSVGSGPHFFACDQHGNAFFLRKDSETALGEFPTACYGAVTIASIPNSAALVLLRKAHGEARPTAFYAVAPKTNGANDFKLKKWDIPNRDFEGAELGICITRSSGEAIITTIYSDGLIVRRKIPKHIDPISARIEDSDDDSRLESAPAGDGRPDLEPAKSERQTPPSG